jgi:hypothetical protein
MTVFLVIAALMAAIAATAVALPLLRNRQSRMVGALAGVLVIGAAAGLYPLWSNWNWRAPPPSAVASPEALAMVARLEKRMNEEPNDMAGWLLLGRSYLALERTDDAILAYDHAHRLDANNVDAMLGLGEAMSVRAGGNVTPVAIELFERAVTLEPDNPKALLYSGFGAATRGDRAAARARWLKLEGQNPPPEIKAMLDERITELGTADLDAAPGGASGVAPGAGPASGPAMAGAASAGGAPSGGSGDGQSQHLSGAQGAAAGGCAAIRVCPRTRRPGSAARRQAADEFGDRHPDPPLGGGLHDPGASPDGRAARVDHRADLLQRATDAGRGRFVRRTDL